MKCFPQSACAPVNAGKPQLKTRPLLSERDAVAVSRLFKTLASDTRLRLLHALERAGELCVMDLAAELGMGPQAISNQLQRLADRQIVVARREGVRLYYRIADPCIPGLLDLGLCLLEETQQASVGGVRRPRRVTAARR